MRKRFDAVDYAIAAQRKPYIYGTNGPKSYDCSGLVVAALDIPDLNSQGMYDKWSIHPVSEPPPIGAIVFYGDPISHVMMVVDIWPCGERVMVGACGGRSTTLTEQDAAEAGALVRAATYTGYRRTERRGWADPWAPTTI